MKYIISRKNDILNLNMSKLIAIITVKGPNKTHEIYPSSNINDYWKKKSGKSCPVGDEKSTNNNFFTYNWVGILPEMYKLSQIIPLSLYTEQKLCLKF